MTDTHKRHIHDLVLLSQDRNCYLSLSFFSRCVVSLPPVVFHEFFATGLIHFLCCVENFFFHALVDLLKHTHISVTADPCGFTV
jgi:hypothetical protein